MRRLLKVDHRNTSYYRHEMKPVEKSMLLDDMSDLKMWKVVPHLSINGDPADERGIDSGSVSAVTRDGISCARLTCEVDCEQKNVDYGRGWGLATLFRDCENADWSEYNRISFKAFPDFDGFKVATMFIYLYTDEDESIRMPNDMSREGLHCVILENHKWNFVTWEFPELVRKHVKGISFQYRMQGSEPGAANEISIDFADVRIEKVDADYQRGWEPKTGEISFSHVGYEPGKEKSAIAKSVKAKTFELIRSEDGLSVYTGKVKHLRQHTGNYQLLDFSDFNETGRYFIKAGGQITRPFSIEKDLWKNTIVKTMNFFFGERCGCIVPGIHDICHQDFQCRHNDVTKVVNGGWHDAGDLSQGLNNSAEATYAMLNLLDKARREGSDLQDLLLDEARWGAEWVLKTRFSDGYRASWLCIDFWSKGFLGDYDDIIHTAVRHVWDNILCAGVEAKMYQMFKGEEEAFASVCLKAAKEDYGYALEDLKTQPLDLFTASQGCISGIELFKATGCDCYLEKAKEFASYILLCQQAEDTKWDIPMKGFFYESKDQDKIVHSWHGSRESAPMTALAMIQKVAPNKEYIKCMKLYAEYIKTVAKYTEPYSMIPASIYKLEEVVDGKPETYFMCPNPDMARAQIRNGIKLNEGVYLRLFPVWYSFRGNSGIQLSQAKGILECANTLKDQKLKGIVTRMLQWQVGRNPFNQSLVWGEGYNYTPQYTAMSGDIVGSFSVGVEAQMNEDIPYYPHAACYNYKEVWVFPAMRFLSIMASYDAEI